MKKLITNHIIALALLLFMGNSNIPSIMHHNSTSLPIGVYSAIEGCDLEPE